mgnify:CR=1 FL=1
MLKIRKQQLSLLEKLTNTTAPSGDEGPIRKIVRAAVEGIADAIKVDALGNLLVTKHGKGRNRLKVMLAAHMDEVGFMVTAVEKDGRLRIRKVGGIDPRILLGQVFRVGTNGARGVIGVLDDAVPVSWRNMRDKSTPPST